MKQPWLLLVLVRSFVPSMLCVWCLYVYAICVEIQTQPTICTAQNFFFKYSPILAVTKIWTTVTLRCFLFCLSFTIYARFSRSSIFVSWECIFYRRFDIRTQMCLFLHTIRWYLLLLLLFVSMICFYILFTFPFPSQSFEFMSTVCIWITDIDISNILLHIKTKRMATSSKLPFSLIVFWYLNIHQR